MPDHALALGARYTLDEYGDAFKVLVHLGLERQRGARVACRSGSRRRSSRRRRCAAGRIISISICLVDLGRGRTMGIGYCPGDEFCDEPYFYTSMWPEPSIPDLPLLPAMAHWHTYKFLAALAPAHHKIVAAHDQGDYVRQFLDVSVAAALDALK